MTDKNKKKGKSNVGMGIVFGFILGAALGFALDNFALWTGIGLSLGIVIGAILDMNQNKEKREEKDITE
jgi:F0F1-type ATP synthase assembly protein I